MRKGLITLALALLLSLFPVVVTPNGGIEVQNACADGSCCQNKTAICGLNGMNYKGYEYSPGGCGDGNVPAAMPSP